MPVISGDLKDYTERRVKRILRDFDGFLPYLFYNCFTVLRKCFTVLMNF